MLYGVIRSFVFTITMFCVAWTPYAIISMMSHVTIRKEPIKLCHAKYSLVSGNVC